MVTVYMNSNLQVIIKMRSAHMAGTFIKTKKCKIKLNTMIGNGF